MVNAIVKNMPAKFVLVALIVASTFFSGAAFSRKADITSEEFKYLPNYCTAMHWYVPHDVHLSPESVEAWRARLGPKNSIHIHHFCRGVAATIRGNKSLTNTYHFSRWYREAVGDFTYTIDNVQQEFYLLPELLTWRARAHLMLNEYGDAWLDAQKAVERDGKYIQAYAVMADALVKLNKPDLAIEVLQKGLLKEPGERRLERRLTAILGEKK